MKHVKRSAASHARREPLSHAAPQAQNRTAFRAIVAGASSLAVAVAIPLTMSAPQAGASGPSDAAPVVVTAPAPDQVIVTFTDSASKATKAAARSAVGGQDVGGIYGTSARVIKVQGSAKAAAAKLRGMAGVKTAEVDGIAVAQAVPNDPWYANQWASRVVGAPTAWDTTTGNSATVIAILDTGVRLDHQDLKANVVAGYDFANGDSDPSDDHGHGTLVAGAAAARGNNGVGVTGACWTCSIMPIKIATSAGTASYSAVASGLRWAADHGARVANISFAGPTASSTMASAVQYALSKNMVVVAAAGNESTSAPQYPAAISGVISVAASDDVDKLESYSNFGSWVTVAAPGAIETTTYQGGYVTAAGTSLASPLVAGVIALALQPNDGVTPVAVTRALTQSADRLAAGTVASGRLDAPGYLSQFISAPVSRGGNTTTVATSPSPSSTTSATASPTPTVTESSAAPLASPSPTSTTAAATQRSLTTSGTLTKGNPKFTQAFTAAAGDVTSTVTAGKGATVTLTVLDAAGNALTSVTGAGKAAVQLPLGGGSFTIVISGPLKTSVTLTTTYLA